MRIVDARPESAQLFREVGESERTLLAADAWRIGLSALRSAHAQAQQSRLQELGTELVDDLREAVGNQVAAQIEAMNAALRRYLDPRDGETIRRNGELLVKELEAARREVDEALGSLGELQGGERPMGPGEDSVRFLGPPPAA